MGFFEELRQQRRDDHRYYYHNRINQFLHFLSACGILTSYVLIFINPVAAVLIGWLLAMAPVVLYYYPTVFGLFKPHVAAGRFIDHLAILWLLIGAGAVVAFTIHLFLVMGIQSGLVWFTKILSETLFTTSGFTINHSVTSYRATGMVT